LNLIINNLQIPIELDGMDQYIKAASCMLEMNEENLSIVKILSKELDLSNKKQLFFKLFLNFHSLQAFPAILKTGKTSRNMLKKQA